MRRSTLSDADLQQRAMRRIIHLDLPGKSLNGCNTNTLIRRLTNLGLKYTRVMVGVVDQVRFEFDLRKPKHKEAFAIYSEAQGEWRRIAKKKELDKHTSRPLAEELF